MTNIPSISRRAVLAALAFSGASGSLLAQSGQPIRMILGIPPGSSTDVVARVISDALSKVLGQPVIVDNKPGGSGSLATQAFLAAPHDGKTWLMAVNGFFSEAPHSVKVPFNPLKDAKPLVEIGSTGLVLVGSSTLPARNMPELMAWAKANKGKLSFASYSNGSLSHVLGLLMNRAEGLDMLHVPYKGSPPALQDLLGGQTHMMFDGPPSSLPFIKSGKLRAFAVSSPQRLAVLPDVPTLAELGYKGMTWTVWLGVWTTPDMPAAAQERMRSAMLFVLGLPEVRQRLRDLAIEVDTKSPADADQLAKKLASDHAAVGEALRSINYKPE
jgi:tripartite-type tricarboxylate transporter receptor subunit TctC